MKAKAGRRIEWVSGTIHMKLWKQRHHGKCSPVKSAWDVFEALVVVDTICGLCTSCVLVFLCVSLMRTESSVDHVEVCFMFYWQMCCALSVFVSRSLLLFLSLSVCGSMLTLVFHNSSALLKSMRSSVIKDGSLTSFLLDSLDGRLDALGGSLLSEWYSTVKIQQRVDAELKHIQTNFNNSMKHFLVSPYFLILKLARKTFKGLKFSVESQVTIMCIYTL